VGNGMKLKDGHKMLEWKIPNDGRCKAMCLVRYYGEQLYRCVHSEGHEGDHCVTPQIRWDNKIMMTTMKRIENENA